MKDERFRELARVLADPTRFEILSRVAKAGELACADLTSELAVTPATISHHVKELSFVDLIEGRREGKFWFYQLNAAAWGEYLAELGRRVPIAKVR
jgi:ArsR family transcriptional regulator, arsenate/arsenite/antimonite-responsive transcriptional repressor